MRTKFFNNAPENTLFQKLQGIAQNMTTFDRFLAVVGYFRSSGYFKLRKELGDISEIKILVGINIDSIFRRHNKELLMLADPDQAKKIYAEDFKHDVMNAHYSAEVEEGILQMFQDLSDGRLEMRIHATKNLHAKFYLCLPKEHNEHTDGWVIMGSSNISESGLGLTQPPRYELNVAMKDFEDVDFCHQEFNNLWKDAVPLQLEDMEEWKKKTHLGHQPTPYELYIKVLIDTFGDQVEDGFDISLPKGMIELKYQTHAVIQGYQMLMQHNGLFLADVVGLGKTVIATMIAKRFIEENGKNTKILVVFPPALRENWTQTFEQFGIQTPKNAQFISNGSLEKIINHTDNYSYQEEFDLIIVDEAHRFRNDEAARFDQLQRICMSPCCNSGLLKNERKKVMLLSATPLNNRPEDLLNQLLLFQVSSRCTIEGVPNLKAFFAPFIADYKVLMRERENRDITRDVDDLYSVIREKVMDKVTIRRTRNNILNDPTYKADIAAQGITFPKILPPTKIEYRMDKDTSDLFKRTLTILSEQLHYARYRAIEFLLPKLQEKYGNAQHIAEMLAGIYRVHMVKRLESSFYAFKKSLETLLRITNYMIEMYNENKVIILQELKVTDLQDKGMELDEIIDLAYDKGHSDFVYKQQDFKDDFITKLNQDRDWLQELNNAWSHVTCDPKFDQFNTHLTSTFFQPDFNPTQKLVLFSESVDTLSYLYERMTKELRLSDVLMVTAKNRDDLADTIKENFDANSNVKKDNYNIIITSDVLAEGVNLHRANVIVNYDSPWNSTRLMQRIGRVNRIGSVAGNILNYMFYPSDEGNQEIKLNENALVKLQGFHSAFGEDAQIYSTEEIVRQFEMFDVNVKDHIDKKLELLREVREIYNHNRPLYDKIKSLPLKSRVMRQTGNHQGKTVVFISSEVKTDYYLASDTGVEILDFLDAIEYLQAKPDEKPAPFTNATKHYEHVNKSVQKFQSEYTQAANISSAIRPDLDKKSKEAINTLKRIQQTNPNNTELKTNCNLLIQCINQGLYNKLPKAVKDISTNNRNNVNMLASKLNELVEIYRPATSDSDHPSPVNDPQIIISETFV